MVVLVVLVAKNIFRTLFIQCLLVAVVSCGCR